MVALLTSWGDRIRASGRWKGRPIDVVAGTWERALDRWEGAVAMSADGFLRADSPDGAVSPRGDYSPISFSRPLSVGRPARRSL